MKLLFAVESMRHTSDGPMVGIAICRADGDADFVAEPLVFRPMRDSDKRTPPAALSMSDGDAETLMQHLWDAGVRCRSAQTLERRLREAPAVKSAAPKSDAHRDAHFEDMRNILGRLLTILEKGAGRG